MAALQGSGPISIANLNSHFGGSGTSLSSFYRGGGRVPATRSTPIEVREPASGESYNGSAPSYYWTNIHSTFNDAYMYTVIVWAGANIIDPGYAMQATASYTSGGVTYYRGTKMSPMFATNTSYAIYRIYPSTTVTNINLNVPASGQISLSQFYGAENS